MDRSLPQHKGTNDDAHTLMGLTTLIAVLMMLMGLTTLIAALLMFDGVDNVASFTATTKGHKLLDFHNKVTTSETLISDYKVRSQVRNNVKSRLIIVYYLY